METRLNSDWCIMADISKIRINNSKFSYESRSNLVTKAMQIWATYLGFRTSNGNSKFENAIIHQFVAW